MLKQLLSILFFLPLILLAQDNSGEIHGDFSLNAQTYNEDAKIGAAKVSEYLLMNGYSNIRFSKGNFTAGLRYESYLNSLQGFDNRYQGNAIAHRYAQYKINGLDITIGNFYEQFGNGLIFRSYEEKDLGIDNAMDGVRLKYSPLKGLYLKGFIAKQRLFFDYGPGIIRGFDAELNLNDAISIFSEAKTKLTLGGSFISKYQGGVENIPYDMPENVGAYAYRTTISTDKITFNAEYAYKNNDPKGGFSGSNFAPGKALMTNLSYSQKGFGVTFEAHRVDNMDFRSDRIATLQDLTLSFIPAISKQHVYSLAAFYPFATQAMGELGFQTEIYYTFKKKSPLGGKYGTKLSANFSRVNALNGGPSLLTGIDNQEHTPMFFSIKNETLFFKDLNIEIRKKLNKKIKFTANYVDLIYNKDVIEGKNNGKNIHARIAILDISYKVKTKHTLRTELQYLKVDKNKEKYYQDKGDWIMGMLEYTISPKWFFAISDQYNSGYTDEADVSHEAIHYLNFSCGYTTGANRFVLGYGKKREGIFCVGGVCRQVPSSNGLTLTITSSF